MTEIKELVFCIFRNSAGKFLLQKKTLDYLEGSWTLFGGSREMGEEPIDSIKREIFEELELEPGVNFLFEGVAESEGNTSKIYVFEGKLELSDIKKIKEGAGLAFFSKVELNDLKIFFNSKKAIDIYLKRKGDTFL